MQAAAKATLGEPIASIHVAASYHCRTMNHRRRARMSEHGKANAMDVSEFVTASGKRITVQVRLKGSGRQGRVHQGGARNDLRCLPGRARARFRRHARGPHPYGSRSLEVLPLTRAASRCLSRTRAASTRRGTEASPRISNPSAPPPALAMLQVRSWAAWDLTRQANTLNNQVKAFVGHFRAA